MTLKAIYYIFKQQSQSHLWLVFYIFWIIQDKISSDNIVKEGSTRLYINNVVKAKGILARDSFGNIKIYYLVILNQLL